MLSAFKQRLAQADAAVQAHADAAVQAHADASVRAHAAVQAYIDAAAAADAAAVPEELLDTTLRPLCFEIDKRVTKTMAARVGAKRFRRYEYILYLMAQLSRIVYCDTGIIWYVIQASLGMSNDVVNKVVVAYNWNFAK